MICLNLQASQLTTLCLPNRIGFNMTVSGCLFLNVPVTFLSSSQCLLLPQLVSITVLFESLSSPSLLSLYLLPPPLLFSQRYHFVPSEPGSSPPNPRRINIHYTFHSDSVIKDCIQLVSPRAETHVHLLKVRTDLNSPP